MPVDEFVSDYQGAIELTNAFWQQHWSQYFTGAYAAPSLKDGGYSLAGIYDGNDGIAKCNGKPLSINNAYYCPADRSLAFDAGFMLSSTQKIGDSFIYMVVAHEWGHAIADQIDRNAQSTAGELVADCLAGATIYGAETDGTLTIEEGDIKEITNGLTDVSDEIPWGDVRDHGDPFERIAAFDAGRTGGPLACFNAATAVPDSP